MFLFNGIGLLFQFSVACHDGFAVILSVRAVLAEHPAERPVEIPEEFDGTFYPPLENVPRPYAIVRANRYMIETCDSIICYVNHIGNTRKLLEYAQYKAKKESLQIENLASI